ncbi:MAG: hypothetical protein EOP07_17245 [Proteobacteria bacterium]|nr:MAG: hypothetical protein EOP07_17245 [Pseudomonadota bacterium]
MTIQSLTLSLILLGLTACTHSSALPPLPAEYRFPPKFYVEQKLSVVTPTGNKQMVGQLERRQDEFKLVLTDVLTGIVLTQVVLAKDQEPKVLYLAPVLLDKKFPGEKISEAIQYLYEAGPIPLVNTIYTVEDPQKRWTYKWQTLRGDKDCLFPEDISLSFADERFNVMISLKELDCKI